MWNSVAAENQAATRSGLPTLQGWAFRSTSSPEAVSTHEESAANVSLPLSHFGSAFDCQSSQRVVAAVDKILDEMKLHPPCTKYSSQQPTRNGPQLPKTGYLRRRTALTSLPNHKRNHSYSAFGKFGRQKSRVQKIIDEFLQSARTRGLYDRSTSSDQRTNHTTSLDRSKQTVAADAVANSTSTPSSERTEQTSTCWRSLDINLNSPLLSPEIMRSWENNYEKICQMNQSASPDLFEQNYQRRHEVDLDAGAWTMANDRLSNGCHQLQLWRNKQSGPIPATYCTNQPSDPIYPRWSDSKSQPVRPTSRWLPVQNCELDDRSCSTNLMHWKSIRPPQFSLPDFETKTHSFQPNHKWTEKQLLDSFSHSQPCGYQREPWRPNRYKPPEVYFVRNYATEPDNNYAHNLFNQEQDCQTATQSLSRNPRFFEKADVDTHWSTQFHCVCCRFNGRWQWNSHQEAAEESTYNFSPNKGKTLQYYQDSRMRNTSTCEVGCQYQPIHHWPDHADKPFTIWSSNLDSSVEHTTEKRFRPKDIFTANYGLNRNNSSPMYTTRRSGSPRSDRPSSCFEEQTDSAGAQSTTVIEDAFQDRRIFNHHAASNRKQTLKRKSNQHTRPSYSVQRSGMQIDGNDRGGLEKVQNELQTASAFYATPKDRAPRPRSASPPEPRGLTTSKTHHCIGTAQPSFLLGALATSTPRVKQILANQDDNDCVDRQDVSPDKTTAERSGDWCCSEHAEIDEATSKQTKSNITDYSLSDDQFHEQYYMRVEE